MRSEPLDEESVVLLAESLPPEPMPLSTRRRPGLHTRSTVPPRPLAGLAVPAGFVAFEAAVPTVILRTPHTEPPSTSAPARVAPRVARPRTRSRGRGWVRLAWFLLGASAVAMGVAIAASVALVVP